MKMSQKSFNQFLAHLVLMNDLNSVIVNIIDLSNKLKIDRNEVEKHLSLIQAPQSRKEIVVSYKIDNENWKISDTRGVYF